MRILKQMLERIVPKQFLSLYHLSLSCLGAILYGFPSRKLLVIKRATNDIKTKDAA